MQAYVRNSSEVVFTLNTQKRIMELNQNLNISVQVQESIQQLWKIVRATAEAVVSATNENKELHAGVASLEQQRNEHLKVIASLEANIGDLNSELQHIEELRLALSHLEGKVAQSASALRERDDELRLLRSDAKIAEQKAELLKLAQDKIELLERDNKTLLSKSDTAEKEAQAVKRKIVELQNVESERSSIHKELIKRSAEVEELKKANAQLQELHSALKKQLAQHDSDSSVLQNLQAKEAELTAQLARVQETELHQTKIIKELNEQLQEMNERFYEMQKVAQTTSESEAVAQYQQAIDELKKKNDQRENELYDLVVEHEKTIEVLKDKVEQTLAAKSDADKDRLELEEIFLERENQLIDSVKHHQSEIEELKEIIKKVDNVPIKERSNEVEQFAAAQKELATLKQQISLILAEQELDKIASAQARKTIEELTTENAELKKERATYGERTSADAKMQEHINELKQKILFIENERKEFESQQAVQAQRIMTLEDEIRFELERNIALKKEVTDVEHWQQKVRELEQTIASQKREHEHYLRELHAINSAHKQQELSLLAPDNSELQQRLQHVIDMVSERINSPGEQLPDLVSAGVVSKREKERILKKLTKLIQNLQLRIESDSSENENQSAAIEQENTVEFE